MKSIIIALFIMVIPSLLKAQEMTIKKIDSTSKHYLITISSRDSMGGIIISKKVSRSRLKRVSKKMKRINVGESYTFKLDEYLLFKLLDKKTFEVETNSQGGISVDGYRVWRAGDSQVLYETNDLVGLFIKH